MHAETTFQQITLRLLVQMQLFCQLPKINLDGTRGHFRLRGFPHPLNEPVGALEQLIVFADYLGGFVGKPQS